MNDSSTPHSKDRGKPDAGTTFPPKSEEELALVIEGARIGIWDWQVRTGRVEVNDCWAKIVGYTLKELAPLSIETWKALSHPDDLERSNKLLQKCYTGELPFYECEVRMKHKDGHWVWILDRGKVVERDKDGSPLRMAGTHLDITRQKRAEKAAGESEAALRTIIDNAHDAIFVHAVDGTILDVNRKMLEMYQVTREQALSASIAEDLTIGQIPRQKLEEYWRRVLAGESIFVEGKAKRYKDGSAFDVEVALKKIVINDSDVVLANVRNISKRKKALAVLRENEEKFRALAEHNIDTIMRFDRQYRHLYVNPIVEEHTGIPPSAFIGKTCEELGFPENLCTLWKEAIDLVFKAKHIQRIEFQLPNGRWVDWMLMPEFDESGQAKAVLTSSRDITERKKAEAEKAMLENQLRQSQKMESVGRLAGGVAHDFNNMLGVIIGQTEICLHQTPLEHPNYAALHEIRKAAERSTDLTRQLLAFARKQAVTPRVLDLNETVEGMLNMLRRLIGEQIHLAWLPGPGLWPVRMDPSQIDQILANLCVNARDAIVDVGKIAIETRNIILDRTFCDELVGVAPGDFVLLSVTDDGCGMDKKTMENLFEPFFTTKEEGRGSGLGLAMVYGIVRQNSGFINVSSKPGQGTVFKIFLPRFKGKAVKMPQQKAAESPAQGSETILLVEDEPAILDLTTMMLESQGYTVLATSTPEQAIRIANEQAGAVHLLITDVVMPGMNGRDLAAKLLSIYPGLKCLFMSGYTADVIAHHGVLGEGVNFIQKPFLMRDLAISVRQALEKTC
jgi:PAS domain S-box-containing protein